MSIPNKVNLCHKKDIRSHLVVVMVVAVFNARKETGKLELHHGRLGE